MSGITRKEVPMKENCLKHLSELISLSLYLCRQQHNNLLPPSAALLQDSERHCRECIKAAEKAFILPIGREDVTHIALKAHRLNQRLYNLRSQTSEIQFGDVERISDTYRSIENICRSALRYTENGFKKLDLSSLPVSGSAPQKNLAHKAENRYNPYALLADAEISKSAEDCRKEAEELSDYIIRTVIKNS